MTSKTYENGDSWEGFLVWGKPFGKGSYSYYDGRKLDGFFLLGHPFGKCKLSWPNGAELRGFFLGGELTCIGSYRDQNCVGHTGLWRKGLLFDSNPPVRAGEGWRIRTRGIRVFGDWIYTGDLVDGVGDGYGVTEKKNGARYEGQFLQGNCWGKGVFTDPIRGYTYDGDWVAGARCGHGKLTTSKGHVCEGTWKDDKREGYCVYTYPSGARYEGYYHNDKRHGYAKITFPDGTIWEGEYRDGERIEGEGK